MNQVCHLQWRATGCSMERIPWSLQIKALGEPGHGAKLYDNSAMENLTKSIESIMRFRASQFDQLKAGFKAEGEVISVDIVFLKAGTPSSDVSFNLSTWRALICMSQSSRLTHHMLHLKESVSRDENETHHATTWILCNQTCISMLSNKRVSTNSFAANFLFLFLLVFSTIRMLTVVTACAQPPPFKYQCELEKHMIVPQSQILGNCPTR